MKNVLILSSISAVSFVNGLSINNSNQYARRSSFTDSYNKVYNSLEQNSNVYNFCQGNFIDPNTYTPLSNSELISVQALIRNGDHSPSIYLEDDRKVFNFCNLSKYNSILRPVSSIMVNSTTDPISQGKLIELSTNDVCEPGFVSEKGGLTSLEIGKTVRSIYIDKLGFLSSTLKNSDQLKVRIDAVPRSPQTAKFFLSGLYPISGNDTDVVINSYYLPLDKENTIDNWENCPKAQYLSDLIQSSDEYQEYLKQNPENISLMNTLYTTNTSDVYFTKTRYIYLDNIQKRICHNLPYPCNSKGQCVTEEMYKSFRAGVNWEYFYQRTMTKNSAEYSRLLQGFFIADFKRDLEEVVRNNKNRKKCPRKKTPRFYIYTALDSTINSVIYTLMGDFPNTFIPPFSSNLFVEVWKNKSSGKLSVRVIYNNQILKVLGENGSTQPWCDMNSCDYDTFVNFLAKKQVTDPATECAI
ncbi:2-phosphoxylose phosphatase 1 [Smittium culicis]|uniref:2-phosphoxylose phosphatase 1 n=1 Tax=Smittium culicis TaxID=133412 RepID=A0A1R1XUD9_9FUNG|nr:2-phosphoxylose phosphatase 1 [Smittium culicis]